MLNKKIGCKVTKKVWNIQQKVTNIVFCEQIAVFSEFICIFAARE
jgi:hypothetical protein